MTSNTAVCSGPCFGPSPRVGEVFGRVGFERWGLLARGARVEEGERDLVIVGRHITAA